MRDKVIATIVALSLLGGATTNALAHRMNIAMSLIEISPTTGRLEVTHSLFAHDLEGALGAGSVRLNWFETREGEAALRAYCEANFVMRGQNNRLIALNFVGVELSGDLIKVYFDAPALRGRSITVDANFLQEVSDSQVNQVNLRARGKTVSAVFRAGAAAQTLVVPTR